MVTVIIPTILRESFFESYSSVILQGGIVDEILIGVDLPEDHKELCKLRTFLDNQKVLTNVYISGGDKGAGYIRQHLTKLAKSEWIAYLDDDDIFLENKLETQVKAAKNNSANVISSRFSYINVCGKITYKYAPKELLTHDIDISDYLFKARSLNLGRNVLETSTLLVNKKCIASTNWNPILKRHQDWDFVLRLSKAGFKIYHTPEVLSHIRLPSNKGISSSNDWQSSLDWFNQNRGLFTEQAAVDFLIGQTLRYSLQSRKIEAIKTTLKSYKTKKIPTVNSIILALSSILNRSVLNKLLSALPECGKK